ncbi:MAG: cytochrome c [Alphaproteobacteria bacterium]|nr:cytochrome c [Alphaproteobacteria bacterium]
MGLALALPAMAQSPGDVSLGKRLYQDKATCGFCHGWSGDGAGDPQSPGKAANLRQTQLDHDQLVETIRCGVPGGTAMPHFDKFAWTKGEECFGMTVEEVGDKKPPAPTASLQKREIEAIVAYREAKVVGKGPPTVADCEDYFGPGSKRCQEMAAGRKE